MLVDILNQIEGKDFKISHPRDTSFFVTAMDVCRNHLADKDLAHRLNRLLHYGNNYDLMGDSYKESIYYRHYFGLLCTVEPMEIFIQSYDKLVPNIYSPEPGIMSEILKQIEVNGNLELIPRFWSDMVIFDHINRDTLLQQILKIMVDNRPNIDLIGQADLTLKFAEIAWKIWNRIENQNEGRTNILVWTGQMLGDVLTLCCRNRDFANATEVLLKLNKEQHKISGNPSPLALEVLIELSIQQKQPSVAIIALQYCVDNAYPNNQILTKMIVNGMTLSEGHISKISSLVKDDPLRDSDKILQQR